MYLSYRIINGKIDFLGKIANLMPLKKLQNKNSEKEMKI
ncbi:hypothetical protein LCGC14_0994900 [marine sediment metagenome]|uniref:Uncharacterized protein n=1 Tax=marine sediment metagenome TaxID=412755 RepID=A0A0F9NR51_9ZZZZ